MKQKMKYGIIILMVALLLIQSPIYTFAAEINVAQSSEKVHVRHIDLCEMKESLVEEGCVEEAWISNNTLTYITDDGIVTTITETMEGDSQSLIITEGDDVGVVILNAATDTIVYNGQQVRISMVTDRYAESQRCLRLGNRDLHLVATTYPRIQSETIIRNMLSGALFTIMFSALGGIGVFLGVAQNLISGFQALQSDSKTVYVRRLLYSNGLGTFLHYEDYYYARSNYTNLVTTKFYDKYF